MKEGKLDEETEKVLEEVLGMRDLNLHTGGRKTDANINYATIQDAPDVGDY